MTDEELAAIKVRAEAATPGPWDARAYRVYLGTERDAAGTERIIAACWRPWGPVIGAASIEADTEFIAHARTDVPALVAEVERLRGDLDIAHAVIHTYQVEHDGKPDDGYAHRIIDKLNQR